MGRYVLARLLRSIPLLLGASVLVFMIIHMLPGDPVFALATDRATPETIEAMRKAMGLDKPLVTQYFLWMSRLLRGDMGKSYISKLAVSDLLWLKFKATFQLVSASFILAIIISFPLGILAATRPRSALDRFAMAFSGLGIAIPPYWSGILLVLLFAVYLGWLPSSGYIPFGEDPRQAIKYLILPALTMGIEIAAIQIRFVRSSFLDVLGQDYINTARAKGLTERSVLMVHAMRNALITVVTVMGLQLGTFLAGSVITEALFAWPGLGRLVLDSILKRDYLLVQGSVMFLLVIFVIVNLIVDVTYGLLDPRVGYS